MGDFKAYEKDWDVRELEIPIDEMVHEYRMSKDKKKQIDILAEQCGTKPCRIAWILNRCGLAVDPKKMPRALRNPGTPDYVAIWESSGDAVVCDRIRKQMEAIAAVSVVNLRKLTDEEEEYIKEAWTRSQKTGEKHVLKALKPEEKIMFVENEEDARVYPIAEKGDKKEYVPPVIEEAQTGDAVELPWEEEAKKPADRRREILTDAAVCVCTDRNLMYGEPEDNFGMISRFWSAYLGIPVTELDVINMMILFKTARLATAEEPSRDSYVDIAGYAACAGGMMK